jgi:pimeloyl-ACP methyl ester carboxylesterase
VSAQRERWVQAGPRGLRICVRETGAATGLPVVLLHGYLEQSASWDAVADALQPRWVAAPDFRGHGLSDHVGAGGFYHFWDYVADVDAIIEELGGRVDLVGHSMGGTVAVLLAATAPERVRRLVLVEGLGPPDGEPVELSRARTSLRHRRHPPTHKPVVDLDDAIRRMRRGNPDLPPDIAPALAARLTRPHGDALEWTWDALHRARAPVAFSAARFHTFLRAVEAPTLLVDGGASPYQGIPDLAERAASLRDARRLVLDGVGHNPHHTCPALLAEHIREHLDAGP